MYVCIYTYILCVIYYIYIFINIIKNIAIKIADEGSVVVVWDREDHIKVAEKWLGDEEVYENVSNNSASLLETIIAIIAKIRESGD